MTTIKLAACVYGEYIYTSTNSGIDWTGQISSGLENWQSITSSSDGTKLVACVFNGYIYTSTDSGSTWIERTNSGSRYWTSITSSSDGNKLAACVYGELIYTSTNSGVNWTQQNNSGSKNWQSITSSSDGTKLAACVIFGGFIYTSTNSGVNWAPQSSVITVWASITSSSDGTKLAACVRGGYIYTSTNSGIDWTGQMSSGSANWSSITLSEFGGVCFKKGSKILMSDNTLKFIEDIKRGDVVKTDILTNKSNKVARLVETYLVGEFVKITKGLIGNSSEIITTINHPFWVNNDENRVLSKDIKGVELIQDSNYFYNIQFEDDDTFYVEELKVDSLSPNNKKYKLSKELFWNPKKHDKKLIIKSENDPKYKKPLLIKNYIPKNLSTK
jgi:hypothetical protein